MIIAILIVVVAVLALALMVGLAVSRALRVSPGTRPGGNHAKSQNRGARPLDAQIEPIDVAAFRNLVDPAEDEYLRLHLSPTQFRVTQRSRLRARAAYVRVAGRNAAVLVQMGQTALAAQLANQLATDDARVQEAALRLVNDALLLRRNAAVALLRIYVAMVWPSGNMAAAGLIDRYERLSSSAMLLGRLRNPAVTVRVTADPS
jgi:flagellar basal body-associated protein FliL